MKANWKKNMHFSGLLFFIDPLSGASAFIWPDCSTVTKQIHDVDIPMYTLFTKFHLSTTL